MKTQSNKEQNENNSIRQFQKYYERNGKKKKL